MDFNKIAGKVNTAKGKGKRDLGSVNNGLNSTISDFTLLYKAAFMKKTNLFATREEFERRAKVLIARWQKLFAFQCYGCRSLFQKSEELSNHNSTWCQMQVDICYLYLRIRDQFSRQEYRICNAMCIIFLYFSQITGSNRNYFATNPVIMKPNISVK